MKKVTRDIPESITRELWARAAGRCQFNGCNALVYKSTLTQDIVNVAERAHIYSFAEDGPRGRGPFASNPDDINDISNLMLLCHRCHGNIDTGNLVTRYDGQLLQVWKREHEARIETVTGIVPTKKTQVVTYGARVGDLAAKLDAALVQSSVFPSRYPATERPIELSMSWEGRDDDPEYWKVEGRNLTTAFSRYVVPEIESGAHVSVFALAPIPLLVKLGALLTDRAAVEVFQLHREPQTWRWVAEDRPAEFRLIEPDKKVGTPVLALSISAHIAKERAFVAAGDNICYWELLSERPGLDLIRSAEDLSRFRTAARNAIQRVAAAHGVATKITVLPAVPVSCAIEFGRVRMPKADPPIALFDQNSKNGGFVHALDLEAV